MKPFLKICFTFTTFKKKNIYINLIDNRRRDSLFYIFFEIAQNFTYSSHSYIVDNNVFILQNKSEFPSVSRIEIIMINHRKN